MDRQTLLIVIYVAGGLGFILVMSAYSEHDSDLQRALSLARAAAPGWAVSGVAAFMFAAVSILWPLYAVKWILNDITRLFRRK